MTQLTRTHSRTVTYFSSPAWRRRCSGSKAAEGVEEEEEEAAAKSAAHDVMRDGVPRPLHPHPAHHSPTPPLCTSPNTFPHLAPLSGGREGVSAPPAAPGFTRQGTLRRG